MTNNQELFKKLEKIIISKVKIENDDYISVKGKGIIAIDRLLKFEIHFRYFICT